MKSLIKFGLKKYASFHLKKWDDSVLYPEKYQAEVFNQLIREAANTQFGKEHNFDAIESYEDFCESVPLRSYEELAPYITRIKEGEEDVLYPGKPKYFSVSSGTTSSVKYIPVTDAFVKTYTKSGLHLLFSYFRQTDNYDMIFGKNMMLQGSPELEDINGVLAGRMSGVSYHIMPQVLKGNRLPSYETNTIADWDEKIRTIAEETSTKNLQILGGIPPWIMMYFDYLSAHTKEKLIKDVFPNLKLYIHGGVNFAPYRQLIFDKIGKEIDTLDTYTASEGFLGFQENLGHPEMTLCSNNGIFYEFVEVEDYRKNKYPKRLRLSEVQKDTDYLIILNTISGMWGYIIGDLIRFSDTRPYQFSITGRLSQYTSLFGEHLIESEVRIVLKAASEQFNFKTRAFTVAPNLLLETQHSHHEWWIDFVETPSNLAEIAKMMDEKLGRLNHLYADLINGKVISSLKIIPIQSKGFEKCFMENGKIDGQNKISVLSNNRELVSQLEKYKDRVCTVT
ncbi:MAG: GH3 auxin-responsive promoter family protein [Saprospiraceae bacterium]